MHASPIARDACSRGTAAGDEPTKALSLKHWASRNTEGVFRFYTRVGGTELTTYTVGAKLMSSSPPPAPKIRVAIVGSQ